LAHSLYTKGNPETPRKITALKMHKGAVQQWFYTYLGMNKSGNEELIFHAMSKR